MFCTRFGAAILLCGLALLTTGPAEAQAPSATAAMPPDGMPFDIPFGTPISNERAKQVAAAAVAMAKQHNWKMSVAIVEPTGDLVYFEKMDGVGYSTPTTSLAKARSAALFRRPTKVFMDAVNGGNNAILGLPGVIASEGGFPLIENGKLIGAIGASGGMSTQDAATAHAGVDTVK